MRPAPLALIPLIVALFAASALAEPSLVGAVNAVNASVDARALRVLYDAHLDMSVGVVLYGSQYGTGWLLAPHQDVVVTAAHVVDYNPRATVVFVHGGFRSLGHVIALDREHDIAVIRLEEPWAEGKPLPLCTRLVKGAELLVIGYPFELLKVTGSIERMSANPRAAFGVITWIDESRHIFEFQATTDQGNSGGPVVDADTHCVYGLVSFALRGSVGVTYFASDAEAIRAVLKQAGIGYVEKAATSGLGVDLDASGTKTKMYAVVAAAGVGGLLLGALLFSGRKRLFALLPLLAVLAASVGVAAHAEQVAAHVEYLGSITVSGALPPVSNITAGEIILVRFEGKIVVNDTVVFTGGWAWCEAYGHCVVYNETLASVGNVTVAGWVRYDVYRLVGERSPPPGHVYLWTFRVKDGDGQIQTFTRSLPSNPGGWCIWANTVRKGSGIVWSIAGWYAKVILPDGVVLGWEATRWPMPATHYTRAGGTLKVVVKPYGVPRAETIVTVAVYKPHYVSNANPPYWVCCWPWTCVFAECQGSAACSLRPTTTPTTPKQTMPRIYKPTTTTARPSTKTTTSTPTATPPATTTTTLPQGSGREARLAAAAAALALALTLLFILARR